MIGKVITRQWRGRGPLGEKLRRVSYGYSIQVPGKPGEKKQERKTEATWSEADALAAMTERIAEIEAGIMTPSTATFGQLATEYLVEKGRKGKRSLKEDRRIIEKQLVPYFGDRLLLKQLTGPMVAQYERKRIGEVSPFTTCNELSVLRHMLRLGRKWGYVKQVPEIELPKKPEGRQRYLEEEEIGRLLTACRESRNPYLAAITTLALNTGMRKAEILGLEWARVDLSTSRLILYKTKSGKPRGIPVNRAVYDALVALEPNPERRQGLVFKRRDGAAWGQVRTAFATALNRAGIKGFRFHDLRHTAASHLIMRGASLKEVQELLGHSDFKMTLRYAHLSPAHLRGAVDRLDGLTGASMEGLAQVPGQHPVQHKGGKRATVEVVASSKSLTSLDAPVAQVDRAAVS